MCIDWATNRYDLPTNHMHARYDSSINSRMRSGLKPVVLRASTQLHLITHIQQSQRGQPRFGKETKSEKKCALGGAGRARNNSSKAYGLLEAGRGLRAAGIKSSAAKIQNYPPKKYPH